MPTATRATPSTRCASACAPTAAGRPPTCATRTRTSRGPTERSRRPTSSSSRPTAPSPTAARRTPTRATRAWTPRGCGPRSTTCSPATRCSEPRPSRSAARSSGASSRPRARLTASMATLAIDGAELHYEQTGSGPDIVWLAAGDHPGANWPRFQTPAFEPGFRNTTYDARGVGATVADGPPPWPIAEHARDGAALIEAACAPPVFLVGLSMGSLIATELACTRPDLVRAALVMGTCVKKTGFIREWEEAEIALHADGSGLPGDFATAHYAMLYYPAEVLG